MFLCFWVLYFCILILGLVCLDAPSGDDILIVLSRSHHANAFLLLRQLHADRLGADRLPPGVTRRVEDLHNGAIIVNIKLKSAVLKTANKEFTIRGCHAGKIKALKAAVHLNNTLRTKGLHDIVVIEQRNIAHKLDKRREVAMIIQATTVTWLVHVLDTTLASRKVRALLVTMRAIRINARISIVAPPRCASNSSHLRFLQVNRHNR